MKTSALMTVIVLAASTAAIAQSGDMKGMDMKDHKGMAFEFVQQGKDYVITGVK